MDNQNANFTNDTLLANAAAPSSGGIHRSPYEVAYLEVASEIASVPSDSLVPVNIDVVSAVITVRGALPELRAMRPEFEAELHHFDFASFDKLETYALALFHLNARFRMATAPVEPLPELVARASGLRDLFVTDMNALAKRGLISETALRNRPRGLGYRNLVDELYALVVELRASWDQVRGRTGVQLGEIEEAELLVDRIALAIGLREQGPSANATSATLERQRAFTLFVRSYEAVRRAVLYLRPDADAADAIAPSLYAGRGGRRRSEPRETPSQVPSTDDVDESFDERASGAVAGMSSEPLSAMPAPSAPAVPAFAALTKVGRTDPFRAG